jgi:hypothetical protein
MCSVEEHTHKSELEVLIQNILIRASVQPMADFDKKIK